VTTKNSVDGDIFVIPNQIQLF